MPRMSTKNARLASKRGVKISTGPRCASSDTGVPVRRGARTARRPGAARACAASLASRASEASSTSSARAGSTTVTPSASSTTRSPGRISHPPTTTGTSSSPGMSFVAPRERIQRAHTGTAISRELLRVAHGGVDEHGGGAARHGLGQQQVAEQRDRPRLRHRQHEHLAGLQRGHHGVHHQVVVLPAARDPRRPARARAGDELAELGVDQALRGRRPRRRSRRPAARARRSHSSSTTCGSTRMNDSP